MDKIKERMIFKPKNTIVMWTYRWNLGEGEGKMNSIRNHRQKPNTNATQAQHPQEQMEYRTGCRSKRKMKSESKIYSLAWPPVNLQKSKSTNHHLTFQTSTFNFICLDFLFHPVNHQTSCRSFDKKCPITNGVIQMSVSRKYWRTKPLVKKRFWNQFCWKSKMTHVQWIKVAEYSPTYSIWSECPNVKNLPPSSKLYKYLTSDRYFLWWATRPQQNKNVIEMCPTFLMGKYCWTCCSIVHPYVLNWGCRDIRRERWSLNPRKCKHIKIQVLWNKREKNELNNDSVIVLCKIQLHGKSTYSNLAANVWFDTILLSFF